MGADLAITDEGAARARALGEILGPRLGFLNSSPVRRCVETGNAMLEGAGSGLELVHDHYFGEPSVFISDGEEAWKTFFSMDPDTLVTRLLSDDEPAPGFAMPGQALASLLGHLKGEMASGPGLHVFVTHDMFMMLVVSLLSGRTIPFSEWPGFLEGIFFWREDDSLHFLYRETEGSAPW